MQVSKNATGATITRQIGLQSQASGGGGGGPVAAGDVTGLGKAAQDAAAAALLAGSHSGATFTYDAQNSKINLAVGVDAAQVSGFAEAAQDAAAALLVGGQHTNVTVVYDDTNNRLNLTVTGGGGASTAAGISDFVEAAQDAVAAALVGATHTNVTVTYNDATNQIQLAAPAGMTWTYNGQTLKGFMGPDGKEYAALPLDPSGNVKANIVPRTGTAAQLASFNGADGEISAATDLPAIFKHNGVAGAAKMFLAKDAVYIAGDGHAGTIVGNVITVNPAFHSRVYLDNASAEPYAQLNLLDGSVPGQRFVVEIPIESALQGVTCKSSDLGDAVGSLFVASDGVQFLNDRRIELMWTGSGWAVVGGSDYQVSDISLLHKNRILGGGSTVQPDSYGNFQVSAFDAGNSINSSNNQVQIGISSSCAQSSRSFSLGESNQLVDAANQYAVGYFNELNSANNYAFGAFNVAPVDVSYATLVGRRASANFVGASAHGIGQPNANARGQRTEGVLSASLAAGVAKALESSTASDSTRREVEFGNNAFVFVDVETVIFTPAQAKYATVKHRLHVKTSAAGVVTILGAPAEQVAMSNSGFASAPTVAFQTNSKKLVITVTSPEAARAVSYVKAIEIF